MARHGRLRLGALLAYGAVLGSSAESLEGIACTFRADERASSVSGWPDVGGDESVPAEELVLETLEALYDGHAANHSWKGLDAKDVAASHAAQGREASADAYIYGEIHPRSVVALLKCLGVRPGERYYDLGSGTGKTVMVAAMFGMNATGVEAVQSRAEAAEAAAQRLTSMPVGQSLIPPTLVHGSFLEIDFSNADVVFANSVLFPEELMAGLAHIAEQLRDGAWIVSYRTFLGPRFKVVGDFVGPASWTASGSFAWPIQRVMRRASCDGSRDETDSEQCTV